MSEEKPLTGGYTINWDEIDENTDPANLKSKVPAAQQSAFRTDSTEINNCSTFSDSVKDVPNDNVFDEAVGGTSSAVGAGSFGAAAEVPHCAGDDNSALPPDESFPEPPDDTAHDQRARNLSNSSRATFVLDRSRPVSQSDADGLDFTENTVGRPDEELSPLRTERDQLLVTVADMQKCIAEYERSLKQFAEEKSQAEDNAKTSVIAIIAERDQVVEEIATIQKAFGDLHRRVEKSKEIIESLRKNEEVLKKSAEEYQAQLRRQDEKYQGLKTLAETKLIKIAEETEVLKRTSEGEMTRLQAALKRSELQIKSLESQLQQKVRENTELTKICDELLGKYGSSA